jgi:DNA-directed RNA polymerase sigma subunit (sigma70/sigma32)
VRTSCTPAWKSGTATTPPPTPCTTWPPALADVLKARTEGPADAIDRLLLKATVLESLAELDDHERTVSLRFGLDDSPPHTLEEVGRLFGVTRERIRQIEATALGERRQPRFGTLRGYLEGS